MLHGLSRREVDERFDDIVQFAELADVIDDPVRTYSSGMFMRLGFSVAVHTQPDILLIDEVLAVGDAGFVAKCRERIAEMRRAGKTLLLVTHDLDAVERWSDEVLWLHAGKVRDRGEPRRVIDHYREFIEKGVEEEIQAKEAEQQLTEEPVAIGEPLEEPKRLRWGSREVEIVSIELFGASGEATRVFHPEDGLTVRMHYTCHQGVDDAVFGIGIHRGDGLLIHGSNTDIERIEFGAVKHSGVVEYRIARLGLLEGRYTIDVAVHRADGYPYDYHRGAVEFAVRSPCAQVGVLVPAHEWRHLELGSNVSKIQVEGGK